MHVPKRNPVVSSALVLMACLLVICSEQRAALAGAGPFEKGTSVTRTSFEARGGQFLWFSRFSQFKRSAGTGSREEILTSPVLKSKVAWDQLIVSWNTQMPESTYIRVEARAWYPSGPTKYYTMGLWSNAPDKFPRQSVSEQADEMAHVDTDILILKRSADRLQVRCTLGGETRELPKLKFLGLSLSDSYWTDDPRSEPVGGGFTPLNRRATVLPVPQQSQMEYPNGNVLCSPTTLSMILGYWAKRLNRLELERAVPEIASAVYDACWKGTGNWSFNMAYAGSFPGMRAYVARLSSVSELQDWVERGIPVGLSLCYDRLRGKVPGPKGNGHLVVCVGFTKDGDPVINDPGTSQNVQKVFPRENLVRAWAHSRNCAYLIYPERLEIPKDRFGHWASWTARGRMEFE